MLGPGILSVEGTTHHSLFLSSILDGTHCLPLQVTRIAGSGRCSPRSFRPSTYAAPCPSSTRLLTR